MSIAIITGCEKEDSPITLPDAGPVSTAVANMGLNYDNQVYYDFGTGKQVVKPYRMYDLAFEALPAGFRVYLNTAKLMFVCHTGATDFTGADTTGKSWKTDSNNLDDDSTAIGSWGNTNEIVVIDRGRTEYFGAARWRKFQLISVNNDEYRFRFAAYSNATPVEFTLQKDPAYSLVYFSFDNNGEAVNVAPPKSEWDVVFTKFTHTYHDEPPDSPYRYYLVTGALLNRWKDAENAIVKKDSTSGYKPFEDITHLDMNAYSFSNEAAVIGFDWKYFDFNLGYVIYPNQFYLLRDEDGYYYKIRFIDFYDSLGNKGAATFEYQRL